jgi:ABC-type antimicrobial peptide transport system permease subunit
MLYGVQPLDPLTYALGTLTTLAAVLLAAYVPARRAADIDPMQALRSE